MPSNVLRQMINEEFLEDELETSKPFDQALDFWEYQTDDSQPKPKKLYFLIRNSMTPTQLNGDDQLEALLGLSRTRREEATVVTSINVA